METKITYHELFGRRIWSVHYYSHFARKWVLSGQFDTHADAVAEADSWKDDTVVRLPHGGYGNGPFRETL